MQFHLFKSIDDVGEVWYTFEADFLEVYSRYPPIGDFVFQFGCECTEGQIRDLLLNNLREGNIYFQFV